MYDDDDGDAGDPSLVVDCATCVMRASAACRDCVVTFVLDRDRRHAGHDAVVFDLATERAVRWFAEEGMVPTLRHRASS